MTGPQIQAVASGGASSGMREPVLMSREAPFELYDLGRVIVASSELARLCGGGLTPLGAFTLAGFSRVQTVFGSDEEPAG
jgi:hypothetical protein